MNNVIILTSLLTLCSLSQVFAKSEPVLQKGSEIQVKEAKPLKGIAAVALVEGVGMLNSALYASGPQTYAQINGWLIYPIGCLASNSIIGKRIFLFLALEAVALYNFNNAERSREELFRDNMLAWNALVIIGTLIDRKYPEKNINDLSNWHTSYRNGMICFSKQF